MARYTLDDGKVRRFWAIERDGSTLHITTGELGSEGRTRSKDWRTVPQASMEEAKAIRMMAQLGYTEEREVSALPHALERAMRDRSPASLKVLADWLLEQGDPWGPVLAEGIANPDAEPAGQAALSATWFPPGSEPTWSEGRVTKLRVGEGTTPSSFFASPAGKLLDTLEIVREEPQELLEGIAAPSGVQRLEITGGTLDFVPLGPVFPHLQTLRFSGTEIILGAPNLPVLETLDLRIDRSLGIEALGQARHAVLPALRHVTIATPGTSQDRGGDVGRLLAGKAGLETVQLEGFDASSALVHWFDAGVPSGLRELYLVACRLGETDARRLLDVLPDLPDLRVDLLVPLPEHLWEALVAWPNVTGQLVPPDEFYDAIQE